MNKQEAINKIHALEMELRMSRSCSEELAEENTELKERVEELKKIILNSRDICLMLDVPICPRAEAAEAKAKELETQLAGRTYCHSDEAVEAKLKKCEKVVEAAKTWVYSDKLEWGSLIDAVKELNKEPK